MARMVASPCVITCPCCGHSATLRGPVADLAGKVLRCAQCGARQRLDLAQVIEAEQRSRGACAGGDRICDQAGDRA